MSWPAPNAGDLGYLSPRNAFPNITHAILGNT
jgi:hypothetical protein